MQIDSIYSDYTGYRHEDLYIDTRLGHINAVALILFVSCFLLSIPGEESVVLLNPLDFIFGQFFT
ncbi:hypothetical protein ACJX0J_006895, partial [Zea mays]